MVFHESLDGHWAAFTIGTVQRLSIRRHSDAKSSSFSRNHTPEVFCTSPQSLRLPTGKIFETRTKWRKVWVSYLMRCSTFQHEISGSSTIQNLPLSFAMPSLSRSSWLQSFSILVVLIFFPISSLLYSLPLSCNLYIRSQEIWGFRVRDPTGNSQ